MRPLQIGILNVMHDKLATNQRFTRVLSQADVPLELRFFYPQQHYAGREVPAEVSEILEPLDIEEVAQMDGFIITGAPVEIFPFEEVTYIEEVRALMARLAEVDRCQLYLCWGGMAALDFFYQIPKNLLPHKLFGVYPHEIVEETELLAGLSDGFKAPHARYAEMSHEAVHAHPELAVKSLTEAGDLFLVENAAANQVFMFAHLEYGRKGLLHEYQREIAAHPERHYRLPENYFDDSTTLSGPNFDWAQTQATFFKAWVNRVAQQAQSSEGE